MIDVFRAWQFPWLKPLVLPVLVGFAFACSEPTEDLPDAETTPSAAAEIATPPSPEISNYTWPPDVPTPPSWDGVGTPPPGWGYEITAGGAIVLFTATPACATLLINGTERCGPVSATVRGCCTDGIKRWEEITLGESNVRWERIEGVDVLQNWNVLPEHEDEFADIANAFFRDSQPTTVGTPLFDPLDAYNDSVRSTPPASSQ